MTKLQIKRPRAVGRAGDGRQIGAGLVNIYFRGTLTSYFRYLRPSRGQLLSVCGCGSDRRGRHVQRDGRWAVETDDVVGNNDNSDGLTTVSRRLCNVVADVTAVMIRRGRDTAVGRRNTLGGGGGGTNIISSIILLLLLLLYGRDPI